MPRLVYRAAARRDLAGIAAHIERESLNSAVAENFIDKILDYCEQIAKLLGRSRPEFGRNYRSLTFGSYVIIFRYADDEGPRSHLYIIHVIYGGRDLDAFFIQEDDNEADT